MISEDRVEKAVEYIRDMAEEYAEALANEKYLDHKRKVIRATVPKSTIVTKALEAYLLKWRV